MKASKLVAVNGGGMSYELTGDVKSKVKDIGTTKDSQAVAGVSSYTLSMELIRRHWIQFLAVCFVVDILLKISNWIMNGV